MNCAQIRELLPALIYGDLVPETKTAVDGHLAACSACREELAALAEVRRLLDQASVPKVQVNVPRIIAEASRRQQRQVRRWQRVAMTLVGVAAALLVGLSLRLEVRWEGHQLVLRWGVPSAADTVPEPKQPALVERSPVPMLRPEVTPADMKLVKDLLHALAATVEERDGKLQQNLALLELRLNQMQEQARTRWATTESYVSALHTAQIEARTKGERP